MAKLPRVFQRVFGSGAGVDQIAQFGSLAAGAPAFTTSADTAQSLSNWLTGWFGAVIDGNAPAIEDMNSVLFVYAYQLAYLMQAGIAEWDTSTTYYTGSLANVAGSIYSSVVDDNTGNAVSDPTKWKKIGGDVMAAIGDMIYGSTNGAQAALSGNVTAVKQVLTQTGTGTASAPPVWQDYKAPTQQTFTAGSGTYVRPAGVMYIRVRMIGGGGGGGGASSIAASNGGPGGNGGATTFGSSLLSASGGAGGNLNDTGGAGGAASLGTGPTGSIWTGGRGSGAGSVINTNSGATGGAGGNGCFGGGGSGVGGNNPVPGGAGAPLTGGGGGGGGGYTPNSFGGSGGGSGGCVDAIISSPLSTYPYVVGASGTAGTAGTSGTAGGLGGSGYIEVTEYYQ